MNARGRERVIGGEVSPSWAEGGYKGSELTWIKQNRPGRGLVRTKAVPWTGSPRMSVCREVDNLCRDSQPWVKLLFIMQESVFCFNRFCMEGQKIETCFHFYRTICSYRWTFQCNTSKLLWCNRLNAYDPDNTPTPGIAI